MGRIRGEKAEGGQRKDKRVSLGKLRERKT